MAKSLGPSDRNALAARNNKAYGQGKTADSGSVQSFATIKNTGHGNFVIDRFHTRARNGYPSETSLCTDAPFPTDTPSPIFFLRGGAVVHRLSATDNPVFKLSVEVEG